MTPRSLGHAWNRFWFAPLDPLPLAAFRLCFGAGLLAFYLVRLADAGFTYGSEGIAPPDRVAAAMPTELQPLLPLGLLAGTPTAVWLLNAALLAATAALTVGWGGRAAALVAAGCHLVLLHRSPFNINGADQVATCWLLYLCLGRSDDRLVLPRPWRRADPPAPPPVSPMSTLAVRLIQVQLCVIYALTGMLKLRGGRWVKGDALWNALGNGQYVWIDLGLLRHVPDLVALGSLTVVLWEVYFPALVWSRGVRRPTLVLGMLMHLGIGVVMCLPFFAWFMMTSYLLFADPEWLRRLVARLPALGAEAPSGSPTT